MMPSDLTSPRQCRKQPHSGSWLGRQSWRLHDIHSQSGITADAMALPHELVAVLRRDELGEASSEAAHIFFGHV